jgi:glycerophosphoryl diester phosphodiesterase
MTLIASHRGGADLWPENSRLAFTHTTEMDVELVEFDVHQTSDNVLVVHHDALIDRMTDGKGAIADFTYEALMRQIIVGSNGETIPTLQEVIAIFKPSKVDLRLEIKSRADGMGYEGMEQRILAELMASEMVERTMITSFQLPRLEAFTAALAENDIAREALLGIMWLASPVTVAQLGWRGAIAALAAHDVREIGLRAETIDETVIALFRESGVTVHGWAAHTREAARAMFDYGVASFTTDRPDLAMAARAE